MLTEGSDIVKMCLHYCPEEEPRHVAVLHTHITKLTPPSEAISRSVGQEISTSFTELEDSLPCS